MEKNIKRMKSERERGKRKNNEGWEKIQTERERKMGEGRERKIKNKERGRVKEGIVGKGE
jgi:hypothetical protein